MLGHGQGVPGSDGYIARIGAVAASRRLPVVTQDDDYEPVDGLGGLEVIRV
jgi:predicted nucleic acid-binding protein